MYNNKQIISKKSFDSLKLKNVLNNSDFVIFLNHRGLNMQESISVKKSLSTHGLKLINYKNKPLINALKGTKFENISLAFQGNSSLIYLDKGQESGVIIKNLMLNNDFNKFLFENDKVLAIGFLLDNTFLTPCLFKSLVSSLKNSSGSVTINILAKILHNVSNTYINRQAFSILHKINYLKSNN